MDPKLFEQKLAEVAETRIDEDQLCKVKCFKDRETVCTDCGQICPEGRRLERKMYSIGQKHKQHWRDKCLSCGKFEDIHGKFTLTGTAAHAQWTDYIRYQKNRDNLKKR